jgi:hypothetical protein
MGQLIEMTEYNQEKERHSSWPIEVVVGKQYTAYVERDDDGFIQRLQGGLKPVNAIIKGTVATIHDLPNKVQDGDCYYCEKDHLYEVFIVGELPGNTLSALFCLKIAGDALARTLGGLSKAWPMS